MSNYKVTTLDFYDDGGELLKKLASSEEMIPEFVKFATVVSQDNNPNLFALVLADEGELHKRFPTADAGNTWLSTVYFEQTYDQLPEEAQKIAAANLIEALDAFEFEIPEFLYKIAEGPVETNLVDVSALKPKTKIASAKPEVFAIEREDGTKQYPIDNPVAVKVAGEFFEDNHRKMPPEDRRQFAVKVAAEAKKGRIPLPDSIHKYASQEYSPNLEAHLTNRYIHLVDMNQPSQARDYLMKVAALREKLPPDDFAGLLAAFDREYGLDAMWDRSLADPFASTFSLEKVAKGELPMTRSWAVGESIVSEEELDRLARTGKRHVSEHFGDSMANAFEKDPVTIFESMPAPQKKVLARMAATHSSVAGV